jgi:hypothetical protein
VGAPHLFVVHADAVKKNNTSSCSGFYYLPAALKSMTCLMGNTEKRVIHHGFELLNLNSDAHDYTHVVYQKYLETNYFIVPENRRTGLT